MRRLGAIHSVAVFQQQTVKCERTTASLGGFNVAWVEKITHFCQVYIRYSVSPSAILLYGCLYRFFCVVLFSVLKLSMNRK